MWKELWRPCRFTDPCIQMQAHPHPLHFLFFLVNHAWSTLLYLLWSPVSSLWKNWCTFWLVLYLCTHHKGQTTFDLLVNAAHIYIMVLNYQLLFRYFWSMLTLMDPPKPGKGCMEGNLEEIRLLRFSTQSPSSPKENMMIDGYLL